MDAGLAVCCRLDSDNQRAVRSSGKGPMKCHANASFLILIIAYLCQAAIHDPRSVEMGSHAIRINLRHITPFTDQRG